MVKTTYEFEAKPIGHGASGEGTIMLFECISGLQVAYCLCALFIPQFFEWFTSKPAKSTHAKLSAKMEI